MKKIAAAKVIQKYFHRKLKGRFQWARCVYFVVFVAPTLRYRYFLFNSFTTLLHTIHVARFMPYHDAEEQSKLQQKEESRRKLLATQQNLLSLAQEHGQYHF